MVRQPNDPATINNLFGDPNEAPDNSYNADPGAYSSNYIQEEMSPSNSAFWSTRSNYMIDKNDSVWLIIAAVILAFF